MGEGKVEWVVIDTVKIPGDQRAQGDRRNGSEDQDRKEALVKTGTYRVGAEQSGGGRVN